MMAIYRKMPHQLSKIKLHPDISDKYELTKRVIGPKFEHSYLGKVDLEKIGPVMAEKLIGTGHLTRKKSVPKKDSVKTDKE